MKYSPIWALSFEVMGEKIKNRLSLATVRSAFVSNASPSYVNDEEQTVVTRNDVQIYHFSRVNE